MYAGTLQISEHSTKPRERSMEGYALLSRSTRVKKAKHPGSSSPSVEGPVRRARGIDRDINTSNGTNRERNGASDANPLSGSPEFASVPTGRLDVEDTGSLLGHSEHGSLAAATADRVTGKDGVLLNEEQCRQILRNNKIKITSLLGQDQDDLPPQATSSKLKRKLEPSIIDSGKRTKAKLDVLPQPLVSFTYLRSRYDIPTTLLMNLDAQGYTAPTEVQLGSLPLLLPVARTTDEQHSSHHKMSQDPSVNSLPLANLLTVAPTGSGKTLAFLVPMINAIMQRRRRKSSDGPAHSVKQVSEGPLAIVLAPTKELVRQIVNEGRKLALKTGINISAVQKSTVLHGRDDHDTNISGDDDDKNDDERTEKNGDQTSRQPVTKSHVLVSTPSAMLAAATRPHDGVADLNTVTNLVLDEADVLLDPLFRDQTLQVWGACTSDALRFSLWSATMGSNIEELTIGKANARREPGRQIARCPLYRLIVGLKDSSIPNIEHRLVYAASEQGKLLGVRQLLHAPEAVSRGGAAVRPPFLVFTQTIPRAIALHSELLYDIPPEAGSISRIAVFHSDLSDTARDRVMTQLRKGEIWMLITTDLLARGVDFKGINGVINYDLPSSSAAYVHRVGRTGRAGREGGVATTFYSKDDMPYVKNVANVIAASERQKGKSGTSSRQWLLDSLPKVSKQDKQRLKKRGVETRRTRRVEDGNGMKRKTKTTISTKSGYERRLEGRREGAKVGSRSGRSIDTPAVPHGDEDFSGFDEYEMAVAT